MCRSVGKSLVASLFWAAVVLLNYNGIRGDACSDEKLNCQMNLSNSMRPIMSLIGASPPDYAGIFEHCKGADKTVMECKQSLQTACPANGYNISSLLAGGYNSLCGAEMLCQLKLGQCQVSPGMLMQIADEMRKSPPNPAVIKGLCSQLNTSIIPCMTKLRADCGNVESISSSISSISDSWDAACGERAMCMLDMSRCQTIFTNMSSMESMEDTQKICGMYGEAQKCLSSMDPVCNSYPQVRSVLEVMNNPAVASLCSGNKCPQIIRCFQQDNKEDSGDEGPCSFTGNTLTCVADLKGQCKLKEGKMTFKELENLNQEFCTEMTKAGKMENVCEDVGTCLMESDLMKHIMMKSQSGVPPIDMLLDSDTWLQYFKVTSGCVSDLGEDCGFKPGLVTYMTLQHQKLSAASAAAAMGWKQSTGALVLVLLAAVLSAWARE